MQEVIFYLLVIWHPQPGHMYECDSFQESPMCCYPDWSKLTPDTVEILPTMKECQEEAQSEKYRGYIVTCEQDRATLQEVD